MCKSSIVPGLLGNSRPGGGGGGAVGNAEKYSNLVEGKKFQIQANKTREIEESICFYWCYYIIRILIALWHKLNKIGKFREIDFISFHNFFLA